MSTVSQDQPAPAVGPRAMAEQDILKIIWPPDGRPTWEDRHKIPRIERALNHLLDVVEGAEAPETTSISVLESQKITERAITLRQQGMKLRQIADILGLTEKAVSSRISAEMKKQTISRVQTGLRVTSDGRPAALRSAAPDQLVEINKMIADTDSAEARPPNSAADHIVEANEMVADTDATLRNVAQAEQAQVGRDGFREKMEAEHNPYLKPTSSQAEPKPAETPIIRGTLAIQEGHVEPTHINMSVGRLAENNPDQPKVEQVPGQAPLQEAKPEQNENPTIRKDRMVEESAKVRPEKVPLTDEQKTKILELHKQGVNNHDIAVQLGIKDARQVHGTVIARRKTAENVPAVQKDDTSTKPAEDVTLLQQPKEPEKASADPEGKRPEPKSISRAELDQKIWEMHKAGKDPDKISDELCAEGLYYGSGTVRARLIAQGAKI